MNFKLERRSVVTIGPHARWDDEAILANARALQSLGRAGESLRLLEGKHVAILSNAGSSGNDDLFLSAARRLGAQVAEIRTELWPTFPREEIQRIAALLDRLYAAVECQRMFRSIVQMIATAASIPVYDHIASPDHPTARIAMLLEGDATPDEKRRLVLQAVLLGTIA